LFKKRQQRLTRNRDIFAVIAVMIRRVCTVEERSFSSSAVHIIHQYRTRTDAV